MRTTLDIEPALLSDVVDVTGEKSPSKAVTKALRAFLFQKALARLEELAGSTEVDDVWEAMEELELAETEQQLGGGHEA